MFAKLTDVFTDPFLIRSEEIRIGLNSDNMRVRSYTANICIFKLLFHLTPFYPKYSYTLRREFTGVKPLKPNISDFPTASFFEKSYIIHLCTCRDSKPFPFQGAIHTLPYNSAWFRRLNVR